MKTTRLTMAQALVQHLAAQHVEHDDGSYVPYCGGVFSIFGHGNVAALGDALWQFREALPTYRAHNEQGMAHAAIAYAKAHFRRRVMAVTTSIGPGATNLLTAAALAHVNRLPVLLLPSDTFASRAPDPVLQQIEDFRYGEVSANDAFRPLTRYFDRLTRPEQILTALPRAIQVMSDPALCGPVCLALPQDVQAEAFDCPERFLHPEPIRIRRPEPDAVDFERALAALRGSSRPMIIAGGGVLYSAACSHLAAFAEEVGIPVAETHGGKSSLPWRHRLNVGGIGVDGSPAANALARDADLILAIGTRLQDFTTGSHALYPAARLIGLNVQTFDSSKWNGETLVCDARIAITRIRNRLDGWRADPAWTNRAVTAAATWNDRVQLITSEQRTNGLPYDAEVIGAVRDSASDSDSRDIVVCAAGTLPAELHKLWRAGVPGGYHVEYGYSCMGYEIAGGLGVKMARPECEVIVIVGDGSYLMLNSEIATSVMLGRKLIVVVLDNRGYGCIQRLQSETGGPRFNNMLEDCLIEGGVDAHVDFAAHARSLGAESEYAPDIASLRTALRRARAATRTQVIVINTTHERTTKDGGCWWDVPVPEISARPEVNQAHERYATGKRSQRVS